MLNNVNTIHLNKILAEAQQKISKDLGIKCKVEVTEVTSYAQSDYYIDFCLKKWNVTHNYIRQRKRDKHRATLRQILSYILRTETQMPLSQIAKLLNLKDHSTVINQLRQCKNYMSINDTYFMQHLILVSEIITKNPNNEIEINQATNAGA